jgi:hypothetical protein
MSAHCAAHYDADRIEMQAAHLSAMGSTHRIRALGDYGCSGGDLILAGAARQKPGPRNDLPPNLKQRTLRNSSSISLSKPVACRLDELEGAKSSSVTTIS